MSVVRKLSKNTIENVLFMAVAMAVRLGGPMLVKMLLDADADVGIGCKPAVGLAAQDDESCIALGSLFTHIRCVYRRLPLTSALASQDEPVRMDRTISCSVHFDVAGSRSFSFLAQLIRGVDRTVI